MGAANREDTSQSDIAARVISLPSPGSTLNPTSDFSPAGAARCSPRLAADFGEIWQKGSLEEQLGHRRRGTL